MLSKDSRRRRRRGRGGEEVRQRVKVWRKTYLHNANEGDILETS